MDVSLTGDPLDQPVERKRARRAVPFDPNDPKTWQEADIQTFLKQRLRLGAWVAWHIRKQGDHAAWGDERKGARRAGIVESVPADAAWGVLDWECIPTMANDHLLWIELKSARGKLTEQQAVSALRYANAGCEVAILRPAHFFAPLGLPDMVTIRLVQHRYPKGWDEVCVRPGAPLTAVLAM